MNNMIIAGAAPAIRSEQAAYECIEAAIMEVMRTGVDAIHLHPGHGSRITMLTFAMAVFYGVEVHGFEPTTADDAAIAAAIAAIAVWKSRCAAT
jgi:hypothetical protein